MTLTILPSLAQAAATDTETLTPGTVVPVIIASVLIAICLTISVKLQSLAGVMFGVISIFVIAVAATCYLLQSAYNEARKVTVAEESTAELFKSTDYGPAISPTILFLLVGINLVVLLLTLVGPEYFVAAFFGSVVLWGGGWFVAGGFDEAPSKSEQFITWLDTHHSELGLSGQAVELLYEDDKLAYAVNGDAYRLVPGDAEGSLRLTRMTEQPVIVDEED